MRQTLLPMAWIVLGLASLACGQDPSPDQLPPLPEEAIDPDLDVLARGPVHEAFAEQNSPNPEPGITAPKAPPDSINEIPPDLKPEGDDVAWIPGYWFWDDDRNDYVWVSGVWRRMPPGRRWVPGYWQQSSAGYRWIAGFWSPDTATDVEYLETPPDSLETGPSSPAPSDDYFWTPGLWTWNAGQYLWQPGYWNAYRDGWTWVSGRYVWTPYGCVYVPGYWDYTLTTRGFLFAPVYYRTPLYLQAGYYYRPVCWIGYEPLLLHLFVRPYCHHLYFGDYYDPLYRKRHFIPCYLYHSHYFGFSSLYVYYQHYYHKHGIDYVHRVGQWHDYYARNAQRRPLHTYGSQVRYPRTTLASDRRLDQDIVARPFARRTTDHIAGHKFVRVSSDLRQQLRRDSDQILELAKTRKRFEVPDRIALQEKTGRGRGTFGAHDHLRLPLASTVTSRSTTAATGSTHRVPSDITRINRSGNHSDPPTFRGQNAGLDKVVTRGRTLDTDHAQDRIRNNKSLGKLRDPNSSNGNTRSFNATEQFRRRADGDNQLHNRTLSTEPVPRSSSSDTIRLPRNGSRTTVPFASDAPKARSSSGSLRVIPHFDSGSRSDAGSSNRSGSAAGTLNLGAQRTRSSQSLPGSTSGLPLGRHDSTIQTTPRTNSLSNPSTRIRLPEVKSPPVQLKSQINSRQTGQSPWSKSGRVDLPSSARSSIRLPTSQSFSSSGRINLPQGRASTMRRSSEGTSSGISSGLGSSGRSSSMRSFRSGGFSAERSGTSSGGASGGRGRSSGGGRR